MLAGWERAKLMREVGRLRPSYQSFNRWPCSPHAVCRHAACVHIPPPIARFLTLSPESGRAHLMCVCRC